MGSVSVWVGSTLGLRYIPWGGGRHADGVHGCAMAWAWDRCQPVVAVDGAWGLIVGILSQRGSWGCRSKNPMAPEHEKHRPVAWGVCVGDTMLVTVYVLCPYTCSPHASGPCIPRTSLVQTAATDPHLLTSPHCPRMRRLAPFCPPVKKVALMHLLKERCKANVNRDESTM